MLGINHLPSTNLKVQSTFFSKTDKVRAGYRECSSAEITETQQAIMRPPVGIWVKEVCAVKRELTVNKFLLKESSGKLLKCFSPITRYG